MCDLPTWDFMCHFPAVSSLVGSGQACALPSGSVLNLLRSSAGRCLLWLSFQAWSGSGLAVGSWALEGYTMGQYLTIFLQPLQRLVQDHESYGASGGDSCRNEQLLAYRGPCWISVFIFWKQITWCGMELSHLGKEEECWAWWPFEILEIPLLLPPQHLPLQFWMSIPVHPPSKSGAGKLWPIGQIWPATSFCNKVLLEHSRDHSQIDGCFCNYSSFNRLYGSQNLNYLLSAFYRQSVPTYALDVFWVFPSSSLLVHLILPRPLQEWASWSQLEWTFLDANVMATGPPHLLPLALVPVGWVIYPSRCSEPAGCLQPPLLSHLLVYPTNT